MNSITIETWNQLLLLLRSTGMEKLALTTTSMCQKYLGLQIYFRLGCENHEDLPVDDFMSLIIKNGNFGRKTGVIDGKISELSLLSTEKGTFFHRLQEGGLCQWKATRKYRVLRPFAWIYQSFRIIGVLMKNRISPKDLIGQREKGFEQRKLIEALGLNVNRTIRT